MPTYAIKQLHIPESASYLGALMTGVTLMIASPVAGKLCGRIGALPVYGIATLLIASSTYPMFQLLVDQPAISTLLGVQAAVGILLGFILAPLPAILADIFPTRTRGTGLALSYNLSVTVFGGFAPLIVTWLIEVTKSKTSPSWYVLAACVISLCALAGLTYRRRGINRGGKDAEDDQHYLGEQDSAPSKAAAY
jgi:MHS family proline/betaine transporter-like MFS transporter